MTGVVIRMNVDTFTNAADIPPVRSLADLRQLLSRLDGESADDLEDETLEFKHLNPSDGWKETARVAREAVVCLANQRGGAIVLGVRDGKRTRRDALTGIGELDLEALRRDVYRNTDPAILVDVKELIEDEERLAVIFVPRGLPPHTTTDGVGKIRVGKECRPLTGSALRQALTGGGEVDFTAHVAEGAAFDDLDTEQITALARQLASEGKKPEVAKLPPRELLAHLGVLRDGSPTRAAILLVGKSGAIARFVPQHEVQIVKRAASSTRIEAQHSFRGPLLAVLEALRQHLDAHLAMTAVQTAGFGEITMPDVSWLAAREAVLNALAHRDWFLHQSVQIELAPDRVLVSSPGGFPRGITPDNVLRHEPVRRNPLLADVLQQLGFVNRAGVGVDRIYEELLRLGKGLPRYEADDGHVRLTLPTRTHAPFALLVAEERRAGRPLDLDDLIVLRVTQDRGAVDRFSAAKALQLSEDDASQKLVSLRERGFLVPRGRGRGTAYRLDSRHSDLLRGRTETDLDLSLDADAVRVQLLAVLEQRGKLTNADVRRITGYSRPWAARLMQLLRDEGKATLVGRGRAAHWVATQPARVSNKKPRRTQ